MYRNWGAEKFRLISCGSGQDVVKGYREYDECRLSYLTS